jgi:putative DNA primase/helicase
MNDPINQFRDAIAAAGLTPPDAIEPGKWIKFPGYQKSAKNRAAWCILFDDLRGGVFGDYSSGMQTNWSATNGHAPTPAERETHRARIKAMQALRESEQVQRHQSAAVQAATRWQAAIHCAGHQYTTTKGVQPHAIKQDGDNLLIPMRDTAGKLHSLQTIPRTATNGFYLAGG